MYLFYYDHQNGEKIRLCGPTSKDLAVFLRRGSRYIEELEPNRSNLIKLAGCKQLRSHEKDNQYFAWISPYNFDVMITRAIRARKNASDKERRFQKTGVYVTSFDYSLEINANMNKFLKRKLLDSYRQNIKLCRDKLSKTATYHEREMWKDSIDFLKKEIKYLNSQ